MGRHGATLAAAGLLVAIAAGCGGGSARPLAVVAPTDTSKVALSTTFVTTGKAPRTSTGNGVWDFAHNAGRLDISAPGAKGDVRGVWLQVGGIFYSSAAPSRYLSAPAHSPSGFVVGDSTRYLDPTNGLAVLGHVGLVTSPSPHHYETTVPLSFFAPRVLADSAQLLQSVSVTTDDAGRIVHLSISGPVVKGPGQGGTPFEADQTVTVDYSGFGTPVALAAPPPAEVTPSTGGGQ